MTRPCPDLDLELDLDLGWDLEWDLEIDNYQDFAPFIKSLSTSNSDLLTPELGSPTHPTSLLSIFKARRFSS